MSEQQRAAGLHLTALLLLHSSPLAFPTCPAPCSKVHTDRRAILLLLTTLLFVSKKKATFSSIQTVGAAFS